jgi:uncharacterized protein
MSGLLALLDDVAAIAKTAAASLDDIAAAATKAGTKAAGVVIDDTAVTPTYVQGVDASRELPMIGRIAWGSIKNKLVFLLPLALALNELLPQAITPLLMLGGCYLSFEGAEKVFHKLLPHGEPGVEADFDTKDPARLEEQKVAGAIKTDFILSAEIMTLALSTIPEAALWIEAVTLALVGIMITVGVYGAVALIVRMDDMGLYVARNAHFGLTRAAGRGLVKAMPKLMWLLATVGTAAMLWVGGSIFIHGLEALGLPSPAHLIEAWASAAAHALPQAEAAVEWIVTAACDGLFGLALGLVLIPIATRIISPIWSGVSGK